MRVPRGIVTPAVQLRLLGDGRLLPFFVRDEMGERGGGGGVSLSSLSLGPFFLSPIGADPFPVRLHERCPRLRKIPRDNPPFGKIDVFTSLSAS